jgi:ATP phosphoribosyltransferase regulatory subunit
VPAGAEKWWELLSRRKETPSGLRDYIPGELAVRRRLEQRIAGVFERWGYEELMTPTLEFVDVLSPSGGHSGAESMYRFFDPDGEFVALRPEMTTPIARLVSARLRSQVDPGRFWYISNVFRYADPQVGHRREFCQAGVEIIGTRSVFADAEAIALCVDCLDGCGLRDFGIDIGHMGFINGLMSDIGLEDSASTRVKAVLLRQDLVALKSIVARLGLSQSDSERLLCLADLRGDRSILEKGREIAGGSRAAVSAIAELESVVRHLECYGASGVVSVDLGLVKRFGYYTGVIFQGHARGVGYDICGGGRYDNLLRQFGFDCPSTGFAIGIERVLAAVEQGGADQPDEEGPFTCVITFEDGQEEAALADAMLLRARGFAVEMELDGRPVETVCARARRTGRFCVLSYSKGSGGSPQCRVLILRRPPDGCLDELTSALSPRNPVF